MNSKDKLTSAIEGASGLDLGNIIRSGGSQTIDASKQRKDSEFLLDPAQGFVEQSKKPAFEQEIRSYLEEKRLSEKLITDDELSFEESSNGEEKESSSKIAKSSLRIQYEAEVEVIKKRLGGLENIRKNLGLSQRKICQLLLVDPSAWTRWRKTEADAPLSIYRSLEWYTILQNKHPNLGNSFWLSGSGINENSKLISELESKIKQGSLLHLDSEMTKIKNTYYGQQKRNQVFSISILVWLAFISCLLLYKL